MNITHQKTRELTGKHVLLWFLGFFALIFAVNGVLVKAATSTFGGVETSSSYKAGLMFKEDIAAAERDVHILIFGFKPGEIGNRFRDLLVEKAGAGVGVRVITEAAFRLHPLPAAVAWVTAEFGPAERAGAVTAVAAAAGSPLVPSANCFRFSRFRSSSARTRHGGRH